MYYLKYKVLLIVAAFFFLFSCNDDPVIPNEEELITTLIWTFTPTAGGAPVEQRFTDLDGDGGNAPVITTNPLMANTGYNASLRLLNESANQVQEITTEIAAEKESHQFFFTGSSNLNMMIDYSDQDLNGRPVGLMTAIATGDPSTGTISVTLRHEPDKSASGVADGMIANAGGETDIEVTFDIVIQ